MLESQTAFLADLARRIRPQLYVEFGTYLGETIRAVGPHAGRAIGVDSNPQAPAWYEHYRMTTSKFALEILPTLPLVNLAFIDSDHDSRAAYADFLALKEHAALGGIIVLHDTYPSDMAQTAPGYCNDSYRVPAMIRAAFPDIEILTLPIPPGITIVRNCRPGFVDWM